MFFKSINPVIQLNLYFDKCILIIKMKLCFYVFMYNVERENKKTSNMITVKDYDY